jgi:hypothetical protein
MPATGMLRDSCLKVVSDEQECWAIALFYARIGLPGSLSLRRRTIRSSKHLDTLELTCFGGVHGGPSTSLGGSGLPLLGIGSRRNSGVQGDSSSCDSRRWSDAER